MKKYFLKAILIIVGVLLIGGGIYVSLKPQPAPVPSAIGEAFDRGDFAQVISLSNEILKTDPGNLYVILFLSQTYAQKGSLEFKEKEYGAKALEYANQALAINDDNAKVYLAIGYANEIMQKYPEAITAYTKSISIDGRSAEGYVRRGHAYDLSGDITKAREDYLKAGSLEPTNLQVAQNLGRVYARSGDMVKAQEQFLIITRISSNIRLKAEAYYNLSGMAFYGTSTTALKDSLAYASNSLAADPTYPNAYLALGRVYVAQNNYTKATPMLEKAIALYPNFAEAYKWQANMYLAMGKNQDAINACEMAKKSALVDIGMMENERNKFISNIALNQAFIYAKLVQKDKAVASLQESIAKADPMSLLVLQFTLENAVNNSLKNLVGYQTFKDLIITLDKKVQTEIIQTQTNKPTSFWNKVLDVLSFFKTKEALASSSTCTDGVRTAAWSSWDTFHDNDAQYFCRILLDHLRGDDTGLNAAKAAAKAIDPNSAGGLWESSGGLYLGCANGVGATYVPVTPSISPTGPVGCVDSVNLSWTPVEGAINYNLRFYDNAVGWNGSCVGFSTVPWCWNGYGDTSLNNVPVLQGHNYTFFWDSSNGQSRATSFQVVCPTNKTITVTKDGNGTGTISGTGISCGSDCTESVINGTQITLTATADAGSTFIGWSGGNCEVYGLSPCSLNITTDTTVTATFTSSKTLTITKTGTGSAIGIVQGGTFINCGVNCSELVLVDQSVTLTASSTANSTFNGWSGGGCSGTNTSCTVIMDANKTVNADFTSNISGIFEASCVVIPTTATVGQSVTWRADPSGGTGNYTYQWSNGATGIARSFTTTYSSTGTYHATVTVSDNSSAGDLVIDCTGTVTSGGIGSHTGGEGTGITITPVTVNPTDPDLSNSTEIPNCTFNRTGLISANNKVTVNTNTEWVATGLSGYNSYIRNWSIKEGDDPGYSVSEGSDTLNKIFTTVGKKQVTFWLSTTTPLGNTQTWKCGANSFATTSVVLQGDITQEQ
jgi:tetratricopeptide (TPR) repeat protein